MKRLVPFVVVGLILVALLVAPLALFRPERYRKTATDALASLFRHPVLIGGFEAGYFPPRLTLKNISVVKSADARYLSIDQASLNPGWAVLWGGAPKLDGLTAQGVHIVVTRSADGKWDAADWWPTSTGGSKGVQAAEFHLRQSDIRWEDAFAATKNTLTFSNLSGDWIAAKNQGSLSGQLAGAAVTTNCTVQKKGMLLGDGTGDITCTENGRQAVLRFVQQGAASQWDADSAEWRLDNLAALAGFAVRLKTADPAANNATALLRTFKAHALIDQSSFTLHAEALLDGGKLELQTQRSSGTPRAWILTAAVQNVPVASLKPILGAWSDGLDAKVTGVIPRLEVPISSQTLMQTHGSFTFELDNGSYRFPAASLKRLERVKTMHYLRKKFPELDDKGLPFGKARIQGDVERGGVTLTQAGLVMGRLRAGLSGRLEASNGVLDLWTVLQVQESLPHLLRELPDRYVIGEEGNQRVQPIYGRVQGPASEWSLRAVPRSRLPGVVARKLRQSLSL